MAFKGRTLAVIDDFSLDEILFLHETTRALKEADAADDAAALDAFRIKGKKHGLYELFFEDSTRTKESSWNAMEFHGIKNRVFDADHSSLNKSETYADTVRMLVGYDNRFFVVRSKAEGLCRALERDLARYAAFHRLEMTPVFINAGDGKHEHPTQELLDSFTFLEANGWDRSHLHVALVGDLLNGRTVHSKADGLRIFKEVEVDLVAPDELAMPAHYAEKMRANGFNVRTFPSIEAYLSEPRKAPRWYFVRDQLERMPPELQQIAARLRRATKFRAEDKDRLAPGTVFYHPLPMHKGWPEIPIEFKHAPLNGWEGQSRNGYFTRIILPAALAGTFDAQFDGEAKRQPAYGYDFVTQVPAAGSRKNVRDGIKPIRDGIVIDHISRGQPLREITGYVHRVAAVMGYDGMRHFSGVTTSRTNGDTKGYISIPDLVPDPEQHDLHQLAALAPGATVNVIRDGSVVEKYRLGAPPRIFGFDGIACRNDACITNPALQEGVTPEFRLRGGTYDCLYCDTPHTNRQLWTRR